MDIKTLKQKAAGFGVSEQVVDSILSSWGTDRGTNIILSSLEAKANDPAAGRRFRAMIHESMTTKAVSRNPLGGLFLAGTKEAAAIEMGDAITAMQAALKVSPDLVAAMSKSMSEQQQYDLLKAAVEGSGKHLSFTVEVKSTKNRSPLAGLYREVKR